MEHTDVTSEEPSSTTPLSQQSLNNTKRQRKHSEVNNAPAPKRNRPLQHPQSISSTQLANSVMKFRLGGSVSDPLNLEGPTGSKLTDGECSTCAPSPALPSGQPSPLPQYLQRDPLNLEGKVKKFPLNKQHFGAAGSSDVCTKQGNVYKKRARSRRRSNSKSEEQDSTEGKDGNKRSPANNSLFRFGNYDRYYGYRNCGVGEKDLRFSLLRSEWFEGKDCLDIGSNTGQITIKIARDFKPRKIVGIDIDSKLVRIACKNLHRECTPTLAPDGRPFPQSLLMSRGPPIFPSLKSSTEPETERQAQTEETVENNKTKEFPDNIEFKQGNYVPEDEFVVDCQVPEYDTILALSVTKWIHLNWGDAGIKRFFRRIGKHLRPGGKLILEPQPYASYSRKKNLTPEIFKNYQSISFFPCDFHSYLLSAEVGFTHHHLLGVPDNESKGFRRPLHLYTKSTACPTTLQDAPTATHALTERGEPSCACSSKKLKSVVGEVSKSFCLAAAGNRGENSGCITEYYEDVSTCSLDPVPKSCDTKVGPEAQKSST